MYLDELNEFGDAFVVPTPIADEAIGDHIDLGAAHRDIGQARMFLVLTVDTAITSGGAATVNFTLVSDAVSPPLSDGSQTVHYSTGDIPVATLVAGYRIAVIQLPMEGPVYERYLGVNAEVKAFVLTGGKVNAFLTPDPIGWQAYPDAVN